MSWSCAGGGEEGAELVSGGSDIAKRDELGAGLEDIIVGGSGGGGG